MEHNNLRVNFISNYVPSMVEISATMGSFMSSGYKEKQYRHELLDKFP